MRTIEQIQGDIVDEFVCYQNWVDRYAEVIDYAKDLPKMPTQYYNDQNLIAGCTSKVWLHCQPTANGTLLFRADADALIVKGVVAILLRCLNNQKPNDILRANLNFLNTIGLTENLSESRNNGIRSMWNKIRFYAEKYK